MRILITGGSGFIGANLISHLESQDCAVLNFDISPPALSDHRPCWSKGDVTDYRALAEAVGSFAPSHIVHLAALANFEATRAELTRNNVDGTVNVLDAARASGGVERIIITSTQYVNGPGADFDDDHVFHLVNDYGASKAEAEAATRAPKYADLPWVIVRPTNVWGPHHPRFPNEMWRYIRRRLYIHPRGATVVRAYGYVENVVSQMELLLRAPLAAVRHRVFYLTDPPIDSFLLLNAFSLALVGRSLRQCPKLDERPGVRRRRGHRRRPQGAVS